MARLAGLGSELAEGVCNCSEREPTQTDRRPNR
jgi:hypothetical protein